MSDERQRDTPELLEQKRRARRRLLGAAVLALTVAIGLPLVLDPVPAPLAPDLTIDIPRKDSPFQPGMPGAEGASAGGAAAAKAGATASPAATSGGVARNEAPANPSWLARAKSWVGMAGEAPVVAGKSDSPSSTPVVTPKPVTNPEPAKPSKELVADAGQNEQAHREQAQREQKDKEAKDAERKAKEAREAKEKERLDKERADKDRLEKERLDKERQDKERLAKAREAEKQLEKQKEADRQKELERQRAALDAAAGERKAKADADRAKALLEGKDQGKDSKAEARIDAKADGSNASAKRERYALQLGAFASESKAEDLRTKLKGMGVPGYVEKIQTPDGERWRVRAGPYDGKDASNTAKDKLKAQGMEPRLMPLEGK